MKIMKTISILVPCYNEAQSLEMLYEEIVRVISTLDDYRWEVLFVNDGSRDNTMEVIKGLREKDGRISYVDLSRNFGKENAMLAGFDYAKGDAVVIMDADLQHPPAVIPEMIKKWEEGYDDVYAQRKSRGKESWLRKRLTKSYYRLLQGSSRVDVLPNVGDFRLLDRKCIDALCQMRESGRYTKGMYCFIGFKKIGVEFETQDRVYRANSVFFGICIYGVRFDKGIFVRRPSGRLPDVAHSDFVHRWSSIVDNRHHRRVPCQSFC